MLVAAMLFFLGIWRISLWYNNELAERQPAYQESRVEAGSKDYDDDSQPVWPVYSRRPLTDNWVVEGEEFPALAPEEGGGSGMGPGNRGEQCENFARIQELLRQAEERQAQIDGPIKELQAQADELDRQAGELESQAGELESQAEELDRLSNEQRQRYNDCIANCDAQRAACLTNCDIQYENCTSQCVPYLEQAEEYSRQAQEKRSQAEVLRRQAQEKRSQANQKRQEANALAQEVIDLLNEADKLGRECE